MFVEYVVWADPVLAPVPIILLSCRAPRLAEQFVPERVRNDEKAVALETRTFRCGQRVRRRVTDDHRGVPARSCSHAPYWFALRRGPGQPGGLANASSASTACRASAAYPSARALRASS